MAYFDNAATTYPKPDDVYSFMNEFYRQCGGNVGRGDYGIAKSAGALVADTRSRLQELLHCPAKQVIFTPTATIALNIILQGLCEMGMKNFYISPFEHNAVTRTLHHFENLGRIQTLLLELARQGISSVIFDYTDGFLPNKLEPEFQEALGEKIEQKVAVINRIPVNPFVLQSVEIPSIGSVSEKASDVAGRISDILTHVYGFGDQQRAAIYKACKEGIDRYGAQMSFARLQELLEESKIKEAKTVSSKMMQFFDNDLFDTSNSFDWKDILNNNGKVTVIQLTNLDRTLQTIITEITLWDAWYSLTKFGNKDTPFVVVLDEAQNLSFKSGSPAEKILREGRKYGWSAWFATQFLKGALDSGEISNLQQAAERLYFKPSGEEMNYIAGQIASERTEIQDWYNRLKNMQKGQCIVQGDRIKPNGEFGSIQPALVNVTSFGERK